MQNNQWGKQKYYLITTWYIISKFVYPRQSRPVGQTCKKTIFFYTNMVGAYQILPENCINYDKSNSRQNSVKGPKDSNSERKKIAKK